MIPIDFLRRASPELGLGFLLAFGSSVGQTYFISLFSGEIRADLGLSHGNFGVLYTVATLASGLLLLWLGKTADHIEIPTLGIITLLALAGFAALLANATTLLMLCVALFGLRLCGQGMLSHLSMTAMARWFDKERGRALSIAVLGYPAGEAVFPLLAALMLTLMTWREVWTSASFGVLVVMIPSSWILGRMISARRLDETASADSIKSVPMRASWTRREVLRDARFYAVLPGLMAPPFIITGVLFHQVHLVETKKWALAEFAACYPLYALSATVTALVCGWFVDRFGAARLLPIYLIPLGCGLVLMAMTNTLTSAALFMVLMGATAGGATIVLGALWAELYGTDHLGSIRSLSIALLVLATAISPGLMGQLLDAGIQLETQFVVMAVYVAACAIIFAVLLPGLATEKSPSP
ncbi:MAG: MFS transporter [Pseudomonadota bacterium]